MSSLLKSLSIDYSKKGISVINIAPGPFKTNRVKELVKNLKEFEKPYQQKKLEIQKRSVSLLNLL